MNALLDEWELQIVQLRAHYEQLLFFSIPKLLNLYNLMTSKESQFDGVAKEVGFLFQNKPDVQLKLRETVKVYTMIDLARNRVIYYCGSP